MREAPFRKEGGFSLSLPLQLPQKGMSRLAVEGKDGAKQQKEDQSACRQGYGSHGEVHRQRLLCRAVMVVTNSGASVYRAAAPNRSPGSR